MADHPLLVFPDPAVSPRETRQNRGGSSNIHFPGAQRQGDRLNPQFQRLADAIRQRTIELRGNAVGTLPDQVLVLETAGTVENFVNAVRGIDGLQWLAESELLDIEPDEDFYYVGANDERGTYSGRLFLVMTDSGALNTLRLRFGEYQRDPNTSFPRGLAPLRRLFQQLRDIRFWGPEDRMGETGLLDNWRFRLQYSREDDMLPFEAELWFRDTSERRRETESSFVALVESLGGRISRSSIIPEIYYHGLLGSVPASHVSELVERGASQLILCEEVMFLRPAGQWTVPHIAELADADDVHASEVRAGELGHPVVALLDGLPLTGHRLLEGRLMLDDPDGYEEYYQASERQHGTGMASLICHGELDEGAGPIGRQLYVRPIMRPSGGIGGQQRHEEISEDELPVDLVHRAVRRLFDGDGAEPAVAPFVRAINLSVCDSRRPFYRDMSPMARLLDWLSVKYRVLFLVSAGNHDHDIELDVPLGGLDQLDQAQREAATLNALAADTRNRSLLSPAETLNGLTVGAAHSDYSAIPDNYRWINPFSSEGFPSVVSAQGPGYRRSVKPDLLLPGGRQSLSEKLGTDHEHVVLQLTQSRAAPGHKVAWPGEQGSLEATRYTRGTSNATALATRAAGYIYDRLQDLRGQSDAFPDESFDTVLMKTLLVHGAHCDVPLSHYAALLNGDGNAGQKKDVASRLIGYGRVEPSRVMTCTDHRVTVLGCGEIGVDETHTFRLPAPLGLSGKADNRRIISTLSWFSPINLIHRNYRRAQLQFSVGRELADRPVGVTYPRVRRGTVQHEVLEGRGAKVINEGDGIEIRVECRADAGNLEERVQYALAVTLESPDNLDVQIYEEIQEKLSPQTRVPIMP